MFQTKIHHFLQSFEQEWLTKFFNFISFIGYETFYILLLFIVAFGFNYKKGFLLFQTLIWVSMVTVFFKKFFGLPRPIDVDNSLKTLETSYNGPNLLFNGRDAAHFFEALPSDVLAYYKEHLLKSNGFPSGHTSATTGLYLSLAHIYKKSWIWILSFIMIILMPVSRMYLGQHFLADVSGGFAIGLLIFLLVFVGIFNKEKLTLWLEKETLIFKSNIKNYLFTFILFVLPVILIFTPYAEPGLCASLFGLNCAFFLLATKGFPEDKAKISHRILRVGIVYLIFFGLIIPVKLFIKEIEEYAFLEFIIMALIVFFSWWGTVKICLYFKLYNFSSRAN